MRRTLFLIPHEIAGLSVMGFGWVLIAIAIAFAIRIAFLKKSGEPIAKAMASEGMMWGLGAGLVAFVLPAVELQNVEGDPVGMAIRGYGALLLLAVGSAVMFAAYRAKKRGVDPEAIYGLAPWTFIGGIAGARLFYVIQYRDNFIADNLMQTVRNMFAFTEGGLVVYGGFIGGFIASVYYIRRNKLPLLTLGDVIVPCMLLGVVFGRAGCLMNGCCYGGRCEPSAIAIEFPPGSPVYRDQMQTGQLIGLDFDAETGEIKSVSQGSVAEDFGIKSTDRIVQLAPDDRYRSLNPLDRPQDEAPFGLLVTTQRSAVSIPPNDLPQKALPVQAAQLLSSASAFVLFIVLLIVERFLPKRGQLMFVGFAGYAVVRFILEIVRVDEGGQFGTSLSISQWVSVGVLTLSIAGFTWVTRHPTTEPSK